MEDGKPNEGDTAGTEPNTSTPKNPESPNVPSSLEEARAINKEKKELLDREEKLQKRREDLHAEQMVGGHTQAGQEPEKPKVETDKEYSDRIDQQIREGKTDGFE